MPYGQSPWAGVADSFQNIGSGVANVMAARQAAGLRQQQFLAQQALERAYLDLARQREMQTELANRQRFELYKSQRGLADERTKQLRERTQSADRLGTDVWKANMPQVPDDITQPIQGGSPEMARVIGETAKMMALYGKTVPLHNIPAENMAVDPFGRTVAQAAPISPYHQGMLDINQLRANNQAVYNDARIRQGDERMNRMLDPRVVQAVRILAEMAKLQAGKKDTTDDDSFNQGLRTMNQALEMAGVTNQPPSTPSRPEVQIVKSKDEYDKLPSGTTYVGPDGVKAVKK